MYRKKLEVNEKYEIEYKFFSLYNQYIEMKNETAKPLLFWIFSAKIVFTDIKTMIITRTLEIRVLEIFWF